MPLEVMAFYQPHQNAFNVLIDEAIRCSFMWPARFSRQLGVFSEFDLQTLLIDENPEPQCCLIILPGLLREVIDLIIYRIS